MGTNRINDVSLIRNCTLTSSRWDELEKDMPGSTIGLFKVRFSKANKKKKNYVMFMLFEFLCGDGYIWL